MAPDPIGQKPDARREREREITRCTSASLEREGEERGMFFWVAGCAVFFYDFENNFFVWCALVCQPTSFIGVSLVFLLLLPGWKILRPSAAQVKKNRIASPLPHLRCHGRNMRVSLKKETDRQTDRHKQEGREKGLCCHGAWTVFCNCSARKKKGGEERRS